MTAATLYGLGLGPGDPELITRKAARLIAQTPVIAYPSLAGGDSFARSIAADLIAPGATELPISIPMTTAREPAQAAYDAGAQAIAAHLDAGRDVAVLCEGDPFFYGSFMYLFSRLAEAYRTEIVPGVTSVTACAAAARVPLSARNEVLTLIPGPMPEAEMRARIEAAASVAILNMDDAGDIAPAAAMGMMIFYTNAAARIIHLIASRGILKRTQAWRSR